MSHRFVFPSSQWLKARNTALNKIPELIVASFRHARFLHSLFLFSFRLVERYSSVKSHCETYHLRCYCCSLCCFLLHSFCWNCSQWLFPKNHSSLSFSRRGANLQVSQQQSAVWHTFFCAFFARTRANLFPLWFELKISSTSSAVQAHLHSLQSRLISESRLSGRLSDDLLAK